MEGLWKHIGDQYNPQLLLNDDDSISVVNEENSNITEENSLNFSVEQHSDQLRHLLHRDIK